MRAESGNDPMEKQAPLEKVSAGKKSGRAGWKNTESSKFICFCAKQQTLHFTQTLARTKLTVCHKSGRGSQGRCAGNRLNGLTLELYEQLIIRLQHYRSFFL